MSSFGSSSGWGAGSRRSLQYDSHQNSDLSTAYGSPPDSDKPEKKGSAFDWFHKMRHDHKERSDKRERAKSPPGSSSYMPAPHNLRAPQDNPNGRGRSMDVPRPTAEGSNEAPPMGYGSHPPIAPTSSSMGPTPALVGSRHEDQPSLAAQIADPAPATHMHSVSSVSQSAENDFAPQPSATGTAAEHTQPAPIASETQQSVTPAQSEQPTNIAVDSDARPPVNLPFRPATNANH
jgi:hypothetical protein